MECPQCNTPVEDAAAFCGQCGVLLKRRLGAEVPNVNDLPDVNTPTILSRPNSVLPTVPHTQSHNRNDMSSTAYVDHDLFSGLPNVQDEQRVSPNNRASQRQQRYTPPVQPPVQPGRKQQKLFIFLLLAVVIVGGVIAGTILFIPRNPAPSLPTSYEAEAPQNTLAGGAIVDSCPSCSGGEKVRYVGGSGTLQFNNIWEKSAGNYKLTTYYINGDTIDRIMLISVNGEAGIVVNAPMTGNWYTLGRVTITVSLYSGNNTIKIYNPSGFAPEIDRIVV